MERMYDDRIIMNVTTPIREDKDNVRHKERRGREQGGRKKNRQSKTEQSVFVWERSFRWWAKREAKRMIEMMAMINSFSFSGNGERQDLESQKNSRKKKQKKNILQYCERECFLVYKILEIEKESSKEEKSLCFSFFYFCNWTKHNKKFLDKDKEKKERKRERKNKVVAVKSRMCQ